MIVKFIEPKRILEDLKEGFINIEDLFDISKLKFSKNGKQNPS